MNLILAREGAGQAGRYERRPFGQQIGIIVCDALALYSVRSCRGGEHNGVCFAFHRFVTRCDVDNDDACLIVVFVIVYRLPDISTKSTEALGWVLDSECTTVDLAEPCGIAPSRSVLSDIPEATPSRDRLFYFILCVRFYSGFFFILFCFYYERVDSTRATSITLRLDCQRNTGSNRTVLPIAPLIEVVRWLISMATFSG